MRTAGTKTAGQQLVFGVRGIDRHEPRGSNCCPVGPRYLRLSWCPPASFRTARPFPTRGAAPEPLRPPCDANAGDDRLRAPRGGPHLMPLPHHPSWKPPEAFHWTFSADAGRAPAPRSHGLHRRLTRELLTIRLRQTLGTRMASFPGSPTPPNRSPSVMLIRLLLCIRTTIHYYNGVLSNGENYTNKKWF